MSRVTHVIFDLGNVVLLSTHGITHEILMERGVRRDAASRFFTGVHHDAFVRAGSPNDFVNGVCAAMECPLVPNTLIRAAHDAHIYGIDAMVISILRQMVVARIPLGFATTTNVWQTEHERMLGFSAWDYGRVARSHELGELKSSRPQTWARILDTVGFANVDPRNVLLIDDSAQSRAMAQAAGLSTYRFEPGFDGAAKLREDLYTRGAFLPKK